MNKFQRRLHRYPRKDDIKYKDNEVEEVFPPKSKRNILKSDKPMTNRCCSFAPDLVDAEQCTELVESVAEDQYQNLLIEQYGFDPRNLDTLDQIKEIKKIICGGTPKIENSSQYDKKIEEDIPSLIDAGCDFKWQNIDNTDDIDKFIIAERGETYISDEIEINDIPKIKVIAEKFMKFKKDNIEIRKLGEKVVCVEYDVYKKNTEEPIQKLRTYFSIKPIDAQETRIPSSVKLKYNIANEDLNRLKDKEIEIIDGKISDNRPYLDDLRRVLKRQQVLMEKKNKTTLDLMSLYKMAKRNATTLDDDTDLLSKAELDEIKDLITKNCASSIHGISRRTLKSEKEDNVNRDKAMNIVSASIITELLRNTEPHTTEPKGKVRKHNKYII